jgi:drug/metabolite transporter (DMT)-like permease
VHNWQLLFSALINPYILAGILLLIGFFSSYLFALSWADLTYVIPTTSFGYILVPLISHFVLNESISQYRWMGIVIICCGVVIGARGPVRTSLLPGDEGIR